MPEKKLRKNISSSLSHQLLEVLRNSLLKGNYKAGEQFFSETDLTEKYGVSRTTVREATNQLVYEGFLRRERGKGTFVVKPRIHDQSSSLLSYTEEVIARGMRPKSRLVEIQLEVSPWKIQNALQLNKGQKVIKIRRVRLADKEPIALHISHLPYALCPEIYEKKYDWSSQSLTKALQKLGIKIVRANQRVSSTVANREQASLLGINEGSPLLTVERLCFLEDDTPIEYASIHNRGDRWDFIMELKR